MSWSGTVLGSCLRRHCRPRLLRYIEQFADILDEDRHRVVVVRNGYHQQRDVSWTPRLRVF